MGEIVAYSKPTEILSTPPEVRVQTRYEYMGMLPRHNDPTEQRIIVYSFQSEEDEEAVRAAFNSYLDNFGRDKRVGIGPHGEETRGVDLRGFDESLENAQNLLKQPVPSMWQRKARGTLIEGVRHRQRMIEKDGVFLLYDALKGHELPVEIRTVLKAQELMKAFLSDYDRITSKEYFSFDLGRVGYDLGEIYRQQRTNSSETGPDTSEVGLEQEA